MVPTPCPPLPSPAATQEEQTCSDTLFLVAREELTLDPATPRCCPELCERLFEGTAGLPKSDACAYDPVKRCASPCAVGGEQAQR